ncbi:MAG: 50S ribosomal protein L29 [Desulfobulbaceae bacterium]|nr:50S ribosomal protein L29 [Desulfobulbaceae bacterium]
MKYSELIELDKAELVVKAELLEKDLFKLKFQHSIRQIEDTSKISLLKKDIARVNTAINMK